MAPLSEPFFRSKAVADEITRRQTVAEQMKWTLYFAKWGRLICGTQDAPHDTLGMCGKCHRRTAYRLRDILKHAQEEQEARGAPVIRDLVELPNLDRQTGLLKSKREKTTSYLVHDICSKHDPLWLG